MYGSGSVSGDEFSVESGRKGVYQREKGCVSIPRYVAKA